MKSTLSFAFSALAVAVICPAQTPTWKPLDYDAPANRAEAAIAYDTLRQRVVLFGGRMTSQPNQSLPGTWEWDGKTWTEMQPTNSPGARSGHAMVYDVARKNMLLFGGLAQGDTWTWDGKDWTRQTPANAPVIRWGHAMTYDSDRQVVVLFGGSFRGDTWEWNGKDWTQIKPTTAPTARSAAGMVYDSVRKKTVLFGGRDISGAEVNDTWEYDGKDWTQIKTTSSPMVRQEHAMVFDPARKQTVLFGGSKDVFANTPLDDTWEYDGKDWTQIKPSKSPPARSLHAMAFDSTQNRTILFGGIGTSDLWEWDGKTWTEVRGSTSPPPLDDHTMAYDMARQRVVLFGGRFSDATWEWDGTRWFKMQPTTSPPIRTDNQMVYDAGRQRTVLVRGDDQVIWEWDGIDWKKIQPATSPSTRNYFALSYDSERKVIVLFGGAYFDKFKYVPLGDTWEYDGVNWTERKPTNSPAAAFQFLNVMAYDAARRRTVLAATNGTWEWDGIDWTRVTTEVRNGAMIYDSARRRIVMSDTNFNDKTHEWDGKSWQTTTNTIAMTTRGYAIAYDAARQHTIRFGGCVVTGPSCDVSNGALEYGLPQLTLTTDTTTISNEPGDSQALIIDAGAGLGNQSYWILGSVSGTTPGVFLTGIHIPLQLDVYTDFTITMANSLVLPNSRGTLSATGKAAAAFVVPQKLGVLPGFRFYHAFIVYDATTGLVYTSSNPVYAEIK